ncbi:hypothetical protein L0U95_24210 (plasmid) [Burkholderia cenocepacia]|uniref:hypothetical protein n=1 Tax=Burkholderia cenocepacia TaxID=95486 RepID=UPI001F3D0DB1|nr:hypothetical protein [Burkholderia cenocepacia]UJH75045.1 hypothetical protein L0U95_24210 [Burkholderia cenocepacia]
MIGAFKDRLLALLAQTQQEAAQKALQAAAQQQQPGAPTMQPPAPPHPAMLGPGSMPAPMPPGAVPH